MKKIRLPIECLPIDVKGEKMKKRISITVTKSN